jgi:L-alanine-DL-glutamate epimerase-like enolase superfamily enzyme
LTALATLPVSAAAADSAPALSSASGVKLKDVRTFKLKDALFLQIVADNGVTGWGEASPNNRHVVETFIHTGLKKHVIGRSVWDAEPIWDDMFFDNHDLGPSGALPYAIAGVDIALWDLRGKLTGLPVCRLLGADYRNKVRAYGSFGVSGGSKMTPEQAAR